MSVLNGIVFRQVKRPDGTLIQVPDAKGLIVRGPVVEVQISLSEAQSKPIAQAGGTLPTPIKGFALIDTGASHTSIDDEAAKTAGFPPVGIGKMTSATTEEERNLYSVLVEFSGWPLKWSTNRAMGALLKPQNLVALIGRDLLSRGVFVYNGHAGSFTLAI